GGKNIYPEEVEDELMKSPYFKEVCVLGKRADKGGEEVYAVIVPNEEAFEERGEREKEAGIVAREVKEASSRLADYKRVQKFGVLHQELPKTTTLKHKRQEIIRLLREKGLW
ncbi:MAG: acyl--CoA ligase, partial [Candidatus Tectomicrobia bacterium]|nr:acyl--CoA ligase [Candidatus Tectomicrobia bacterium]